MRSKVKVKNIQFKSNKLVISNYTKLLERICSLDTHFELFTEGKGQKEKNRQALNKRKFPPATQPTLAGSRTRQLIRVSK